MRFIPLAILLLIAGCSAKRKDGNQTQNGHEELYSMPEALEQSKDTKNLKRIVIASTNDLHGHFGPLTVEFKDANSEKKQSMKIGGVDYFASYLSILKENYPHTLLVDSGDIFASSPRKLSAVSRFYKTFDYDAITFGLGDFNLRHPKSTPAGSSLLQEFAKKANTPIVLSNLYDLKTARGVEWKGVKPYVIKEINGIKVGILGIVPDDIVSLTPLDNRVGLYVENMVQNTLRYARLVRSLGAQLIVVVTHQGIHCGEEIAEAKKLPLKKVNFDPEKSEVCALKGVMGQYLDRLPAKLVDIVIGGRHHEKMANIVKGMVIQSGFENGQSLSYTEFYFDSKNNLLPEKTVINQPVMICHEFFKETKDCYWDDPSVDHSNRVSARFLGKEIKPDEDVREKFKRFFIASSNPVLKNHEIRTVLKNFQTDMVLLPSKSGHSQLLSVELTGVELSKILEEKFNSEETKSFAPVSFKLSEKKLHFEVAEKALERERTYRILSDLETLQDDHHLRAFITSPTTKTYSTLSWNDLDLVDEVSSAMASNQRQ